MSQNSAILNHLKQGFSITPMVAFEQFNCLRLAARIEELRNQGYPIETNIVGLRGKTVAEYTMAVPLKVGDRVKTRDGYFSPCHGSTATGIIEFVRKDPSGDPSGDVYMVRFPSCMAGMRDQWTALYRSEFKRA